MVRFILILTISLVATLLTHELSLKKSWGGIRASSFLTLVFVLLTTILPMPIPLKYQLVFLGGSFVGMSDPKRLNKKQLAIASLIFTLLFIYFINFLKGFGGALGLSAFLSCITVTLLTMSGRKVKQKFKARKTPY